VKAHVVELLSRLPGNQNRATLTFGRKRGKINRGCRAAFLTTDGVKARATDIARIVLVGIFGLDPALGAINAGDADFIDLTGEVPR
jgi:hypothetical protein